MHGSVSFFELGVGDADKGRAFYEGLFGWAFETGPSGNGWVISAPGTGGGMHAGDAGGGPYVFFEVDDMDGALARVRELGGSVDDPELGDTDDSAKRFGRFKLCTDDQGSSFGLHQPPQR